MAMLKGHNRIARSRGAIHRLPYILLLLVVLLGGMPVIAPDRPGIVSAEGDASPSTTSTSVFRTFGAITESLYPNWDFSYTAAAEQHAVAEGIHDNRIMLFWSTNQPKSTDKNYFDWTVNDSIIAAMPNATLLGMIGNNIDWGPYSCSIPGGCTGPNRSIDGMLTPTRPALAGTDAMWSDWDIYVYKTVSRYGPQANNQGAGYGKNRIKTWQVMNEIDSTLGLNYTDAQIADRGQKYGAILSRTVQIIKLADPAAVIISCGISDYYPNESVPNQTAMLARTKIFIDAVAATGAYGAIDGFSVHAYWAMALDGGTSMKAYLDSYTQELQRIAGRSIPLWITEAGFLSNSLGQGCGPGCNATFETEPRMMVQNLTQMLGNPQTAALYWFLTGTHTPQGGSWDPDSFALAKPCDGNATDWIESARGMAFYAYKRLVFDKGYSFVSYQSAGDVSSFVFGNGTDFLDILWTKTTATMGYAGIDATTFGHLAVSDYLGNTIKLGGAPATTQTILTEEPILVTSPTKLDIQQFTFGAGPTLNQRSGGAVSANCDTISGWACNAGDYSRPLIVGLFDGDITQAKAIAYVSASQSTGDAATDSQVAVNCGGFGARSFGIATPSWLKLSGQHTVTAYALNLDGSPASKLVGASVSAATFNCVTPAPTARATQATPGPSPPAQPTSRPGPSPVAASPTPLPLPVHR